MMNRRNFLGLSLKAAAVAPVAAVAMVMDTPDPLLGKDIPLLGDRDMSTKVDGAALIADNKIIATKRFSSGRYVIPGDELKVTWWVKGSYHFNCGDPVPVSEEAARKFALKRIAERKAWEKHKD